jgi:hypothetical protein
MKTFLRLMACLGMLAGPVVIVAAGETTNTDEVPGAPANEVAPAPQLSPGVGDIIRMAQAKVSDSVVLAYINNSGTVYNLDANQIIYLRDLGVSEAVISTMLNQRQKYTTPPANPTPQSESPAPAPATDYSQPQTSYAEATPASTVYVIPYNNGYTYYGGYSYYPYYYYPAYYHPYCYSRYPVCYNRFACHNNFHSSGFAVGFHSSGVHQFASAGGFHSMGGMSHGHR